MSFGKIRSVSRKYELSLECDSITLHTGLNVTNFELHHGRELRTELVDKPTDSKSYLCDWTKLIVSVLPKQIPMYVGRNEKRELSDHIFLAKREVPCCSTNKSLNRRPAKPVSGNVLQSYAFFEKENQKKSLRKYREQPEKAIDGPEHTVRRADNRVFDKKLKSTTLKLPKLPKKDMSSNRHQLPK